MYDRIADYETVSAQNYYSDYRIDVCCYSVASSRLIDFLMNLTNYLIKSLVHFVFD